MRSADGDPEADRREEAGRVVTGQAKDSRPLTVRVTDELRERIEAGDYAPGDKLPTEAALSARFGVNRHTVRHALGALADEGVVYARRGFRGCRATSRRRGRSRLHCCVVAWRITPARPPG